MSVNKAILIGRLGKDPELKYTTSGAAVCSFSIATSRKWTKDGNKEEHTTWHNIVAWAKLAEVMAEHLSKGKEVYIEGRIDNRSYDDKEGNKKYISEIVVERFTFIGDKSDKTGGGTAQPQPAGVDTGQDTQQDDLPF